MTSSIKYSILGISDTNNQLTESELTMKQLLTAIVIALTVFVALTVTAKADKPTTYELEMITAAKPAIHTADTDFTRYYKPSSVPVIERFVMVVTDNSNIWVGITTWTPTMIAENPVRFMEYLQSQDSSLLGHIKSVVYGYESNKFDGKSGATLTVTRVSGSLPVLNAKVTNNSGATILDGSIDNLPFHIAMGAY